MAPCEAEFRERPTRNPTNPKNRSNCIDNLALQLGFEPRTLRLTAPEFNFLAIANQVATPITIVHFHGVSDLPW